jgi:hypothetical protein
MLFLKLKIAYTKMLVPVKIMAKTGETINCKRKYKITAINKGKKILRIRSVRFISG